MAEVTIEYCVPCGFRERAIDLADGLLGALGGEIDRVVLETGGHGVFRVAVDGESVYDTDRAFDIDGIVRSVRAAL